MTICKILEITETITSSEMEQKQTYNNNWKVETECVRFSEHVYR